MKPELQNKLFEKYPTIFKEKDLPMNETCMCWGCECGDGWYPLIDELCRKLKIFYDDHQIEVKFVQVKEKYGTLRIYYNTHSETLSETKLTKYFNGHGVCYGTEIEFDKLFEFIDNLIVTYCDLSSIICERCGMTGAETVWVRGWMTTLCERCKNESCNTSETVHETVSEEETNSNTVQTKDNGSVLPENGDTN